MDKPKLTLSEALKKANGKRFVVVEFSALGDTTFLGAYDTKSGAENFAFHYGERVTCIDQTSGERFERWSNR